MRRCASGTIAPHGFPCYCTQAKSTERWVSMPYLPKIWRAHSRNGAEHLRSSTPVDEVDSHDTLFVIYLCTVYHIP